ncbi:MAG TPA: acyl-CoA dehydrogenase family protein [Solirubrobacterales bacterium]|nr:acyl-CoA dehydrogenase family protein [Solirubrobacterales bacterium]
MTTTVQLNSEQEEIRGVARSFLQSRLPSDKVRELAGTDEGFEAGDWSEIAELGWTSIAIPEERGGAGYTLIERCLLLEEMGRVLYGGPFLSSAVLASDSLLLVADSERGGDLLAGIAEGSVRATLVAAGDLLAGTDPAGAVRASASAGEGWALDGDCGLVLDALSAELLLAAARLEDGSLGLFAVEAGAAGVEREAAATVDETRRTGTVRFAGASAERLDDGSDTERALREVLDRGAISLAAEIAGGTRRAIEMTVAYMHEREQFGGPIGRFQALKHRLADLHVAADAAREATYSAADAALAGDPQLSLAAAAAKAAAAECFVRTGAEAVQLHGGIGFTEEHDIGLFYKRALVCAPLLGSPLAQYERIAAGLDV